MVTEWPFIRPVMVRRRLLALILIACLPACSMAVGNSVSIDGDGGRRASSLVIGSSGAGNYLAGRHALDQHDLPAASGFLLKALSRDPDNTEFLQKALLALAGEGRFSEAADISRRLLDFDADAGLAAMLLAEQDAKNGRWAAVEARIVKLPRRGANAFLVPLITAWARAGQGQTDAAIEALDPLAQTSNFAAMHDFHAALIADLGDRRAVAERYYHSLLSGDAGQTVRTVDAATAFYRRTGQPDKANEILTRFRKRNPEAMESDPGQLSARPVASAQMGLAEALFGAAGSWRQARLPDLALVFVRMAIDLQPDFPLAQVMAGDLLQELGRLPEANAAFAKIDPKAQLYWPAQLRIAANMDELGDVDGAIGTLEAISERSPNRVQGLLTLGDVLRRHDRWTEAADAYSRAIAASQPDESELWAVYYSRGIALERSKQWARAESDFLRALELKPDDPHVLNYLGYSWIEQGINLERAQKMIERAVEQRPTDGYIVDSLGWAYYRTGNYKKAAETLERAVELHPEDATINDHFGDALWRVGRLEEANFQWRRALTFKPEAELEAQIQQKLNGAGPADFQPANNANAIK